MKTEKRQTKQKQARYFEFEEEASEELRKWTDRTGKSMKTVLEDLITGRRLFHRDIEDFIAKETTRTGHDRWRIIEAAVHAYASATDEERRKALGKNLIAHERH